MITQACHCEAGFGIAHDHYMGSDAQGYVGTVWDPDRLGRIWVDWPQVAKELCRLEPAPSVSKGLVTTGGEEKPRDLGPRGEVPPLEPHKMQEC